MTTVEQVSFADLYIHTLHPRLDPPQAEIDALATNIRELGLIQNLAGLRDKNGKVGVIAGGRRLRALAQLQDDERFALVPVGLAADGRQRPSGPQPRTACDRRCTPPTKSTNMPSCATAV
jgi:ParB family chromosome partitioning protein